MNRQSFLPESEAGWHALRAQDLTSTDIAALFGLSPYKTPFELWQEKKAGERIKFVENQRMKWGKRLESAVAHGIADEQGWSIRPMKEYVRLTGLHLGSSFDFRVMTMPAGPVTATEVKVAYEAALAGEFRWPDTPDDSILEIKCVDWLAFKNGWVIDDDFIEAPAHIEIQVQHQMLVSGLPRAYIGVMVGGNDIRVIERVADPQVHAGILAKSREFWKSIEENRAPDPVMPDDAEAIIHMNQFAEPGKLFDARDKPDVAAMIADYARIKGEARDLGELADVRKAEILMRIGDAEKVLIDGFSVSAGMVGPCEVAYTRQGYRNFRVTPKKTAKVPA